MTLQRADSPEWWTAAHVLVTEDAASLGFDLTFQGFQHEIASLSSHYGPPHGAFVLAVEDGELLGCGGLRRVSATACEMKRLYVRPRHQGRGVGRLIAEALIGHARELGYREVLLDTAPSMTRAHALYVALAFTPTAAYYDNPIPGATFWRLDIGGREGASQSGVQGSGIGD